MKTGLKIEELDLETMDPDQVERMLAAVRHRQLLHALAGNIEVSAVWAASARSLREHLDSLETCRN